MALTLTNFVQDQIDEIEETYGSLASESGSNSNGNWFKFPGGLMIQYGTYSSTTDSAQLVYLPTAFYNTNYSVLAGISTRFSPSKTVSTFTWDRGDEADGTLAIDWIAIGRWE